MTVSMVPEGPVWSIERRPSSGHLFWTSASAKVKFRCDVEVKEYVKDPAEHRMDYLDNVGNTTGSSFDDQMSYSLVVCATCVAAIAVTVVLPWLLIAGST